MKNTDKFLFIILLLSISLNVYQFINKSDEKEIKVFKDKNDTKELYTYDAFGVIGFPVKTNKILINDEYKGIVMLAISNSTLTNPVVIIADTIINGKLFGRVDTFQTFNWQAEVKRKFDAKGEKTIYGKYCFWPQKNRKICLDFSIPVVVK